MNQIRSKDIIIAVLPFQNSSKENDLNYFVDGFYEDFVMDITRFNTLQIISPNSAKKFISKNESDSGSYKELGADFIIKGNIRKVDEIVKIYIQLLSVKNNSIIWANRFVEDIQTIFKIQEEIIQKIINSIQEQIDTNLLYHSRTKKTKNLASYDFWLRGYEQLQKGTLESDLKAREYFEKALDNDKFCSRAYTGLSLSYFNEWSCQLWDLWDSSMTNALKYAQKAIELDPNDVISLTVIGRIFLYRGEYEKGEYFLEKSLKLNPNEANNLAQIAMSFVYLGRLNEAQELYTKAKILNPLNEESYYASGMLIHFELGNYKKSIELGLKTNFNKVWVDLPAIIAAAYYMTGDVEQMQKYWNIYLENFKERICHNKETDSQTALEWIVRISPYKNKTNFIPFWEYIAKNYHQNNALINKKTPQSNSNENKFIKGTGLWEMSYDKRTVFLSDKKGYYDIANLLAKPNIEIHCSDLMGNAINFEQTPLIMDDKAKTEYRNRLIDLDKEIQDFDLNNDYENVIKLREEYDAIVDHLTKSINVKGRTKKFSDATEKARVAITWRIRDAIKKINTVHPEFGKHLSVAISTGNYCSYSPENNIEWLL